MRAQIREALSIHRDSFENHIDFHKQILVNGTGDVKPNRGSVCIIKMTNVHNVDLSKEKLGRYDFADGCKVTIGEEGGLLPDLFDKVIMTMKKGEQAFVQIGVDVCNYKEWVSPQSAKAFKFNILLASFERSTDLEDLSWCERVKRAENLTTKASELFKSKEFRRAIWKSETAIEYLRIESKSNKPPDELLPQYQTLLVQCHLNIAQSLLKLKIKPERVVEHCKAVFELEDKSAKALFFLAEAYFELCEYSEARADFVSVRDIEPQNNEVERKIADIDSILKQ